MANKRAPRKPWEYPCDYTDDPASAKDRRLAERFDEGDHSVSVRDLNAGLAAYHRRRADHAAKWRAANTTADRKDQEQAVTYQVQAEIAEKWFEEDTPASDPPDLKALFLETHNRLYFWQALWSALSKPRKADASGEVTLQIPDWCLIPLKSLAGRLLHLGKPGAPRATSANVQKALKLISQGSNAYLARDRRRRSQSAIDLAGALEAAGLTPQRARKVVFSHINDDRALRRAGKRGRPARKPPMRS
jgi:hypothetical protein